MRRKMARSAPPPPFGPPGVAAVVRAASLACQNAVKAQKFVPLQESSEESRLNAHTIRADTVRGVNRLYRPNCTIALPPCGLGFG